MDGQAQPMFRHAVFTTAQNAERQIISALVLERLNGFSLVIARLYETALQDFDVACIPFSTHCSAVSATSARPRDRRRCGVTWLDNIAPLIHADAELAMSLGQTVVVQ